MKISIVFMKKKAKLYSFLSQTLLFSLQKLLIFHSFVHNNSNKKQQQRNLILKVDIQPLLQIHLSKIPKKSEAINLLSFCFLSFTIHIYSNIHRCRLCVIWHAILWVVAITIRTYSSVSKQHVKTQNEINNRNQ